LLFKLNCSWDILTKHKVPAWREDIGKDLFGVNRHNQPEGYFAAITFKIETMCKDEMTKEALLEKASAKKIRLVCDAKKCEKNGKSICAFEDGVLVIYAHDNSGPNDLYPGYIGDVGVGLEKLL